KGDITGDGAVNTMDVLRANAHAKGSAILSGYDFDCANVVGTEKAVDTLDVMRLNAHAKGSNKLW
ncbi:MAG: hypothetical protein IJI50_01090, partial [Ruminococcus sp.]|nr:hypothetical protein [Ruminococcus sp.]